MFRAAVAGLLACTAIVSTASAATLIAGNNGLDEQVHSAGTQSASNTVYGVTKDTSTSVSFYSTSTLSINGSGYALIGDADTGSTPFNNLQIFLTSSPNGFTALEFSVQFSSSVTPSHLTVSYDLIGGGSGSFAPITFSNAGLKDYQLVGGAGEIFSRVYLTSDDPMDKVKQIDIDLASAVPEPATWLTMIAGFGMVGVAMRRRRSVTQLA